MSNPRNVFPSLKFSHLVANQCGVNYATNTLPNSRAAVVTCENDNDNVMRRAIFIDLDCYSLHGCCRQVFGYSLKDWCFAAPMPLKVINYIGL